jgi:hypothetical protein
MPWLLYPQGKSPWYPLDRRLCGPQSHSGPLYLCGIPFSSQCRVLLVYSPLVYCHSTLCCLVVSWTNICFLSASELLAKNSSCVMSSSSLQPCLKIPTQNAISTDLFSWLAGCNCPHLRVRANLAVATLQCNNKPLTTPSCILNCFSGYWKKCLLLNPNSANSCRVCFLSAECVYA